MTSISILMTYDSDGIIDGWEVMYRFDPFNKTDATLDLDNDNLTNLEEFLIGTNPWLNDTDHDGMPDGWEYHYGLNPLDPSDADLDPDGDGLTNKEEYQHNTDPFKWDTDGDGLCDGYEVAYGLDPNNILDGIIVWLTIIIAILAIAFFIVYILYKDMCIPS